MDKGGGRKGRGAGRHTASTSHIESHAQAFIRSPSADARYPNQLPQPLARALIDPDYADLPGVGAGPDREPGDGAVIMPVAAPMSSWSFLSPNPPKDTDGRREDSGRGVRELQGR